MELTYRYISQNIEYNQVNYIKEDNEIKIGEVRKIRRKEQEKINKRKMEGRIKINKDG